MRLTLLSLPLTVLTTLAGLLLAGCGRSDAPAGKTAREAAPVTFGFLVKQPEEPWFQLEWKFAEQAAQDLGFRLVRIGATDGEKVLSRSPTRFILHFLCFPKLGVGP